MRPRFLLIFAVLLLVLGGLILFHPPQNEALAPIMPTAVPSSSVEVIATTTVLPSRQEADPITGASYRVTKKPLGIRVTPADSPVSPEKFQGYHTGVDFETTAAEQDEDVPVSAFCEGKLLQKRSATGYGGIVVQACAIEGKAVTVVYGHLRLTSVTTTVGTLLRPGDQIGILGKGYTAETDGERKHLHLGIHQGAGIDIRGYVSTKGELTNWVDIQPFLRS